MKEIKITIKWGTDKDKTKTYTFKNDEELKFFMMGVDEANGWLEYEDKRMKKFTIEVSHAIPGQLQTIAAELRIMSNDWEKFGPLRSGSMARSCKRQASGLKEAASNKQQAASVTN